MIRFNRLVHTSGGHNLSQHEQPGPPPLFRFFTAFQDRVATMGSDTDASQLDRFGTIGIGYLGVCATSM